MANQSAGEAINGPCVPQMVSNTAGLLKTVLELSRSNLQKQNPALPTIPASPDHIHSRRSLRTSLRPPFSRDGSRSGGRDEQKTKTANGNEKAERTGSGNGRSPPVFASHHRSWSGTSSDEESDSKAESEHGHRVTIENDEKGNHVTPWKRVISFWKTDQTGGSQGSKMVEEQGIGGNAMTLTETLADDEDFKVTMTKTQTLDTLLSPDIPSDTLKDDTETQDENSCFTIPVEHLNIQPIVRIDPSYPPEPNDSGSVQLTAALGEGRWHRDAPPQGSNSSCRLQMTRGRNVTLPKTKRRRPNEIFRKISLSPSTAFLRRNNKTAPRSVSAGSLYFENAVFSSLDSEQRCPKDTSRARTVEDISWTEDVKDASSRVFYLNKCVEMKHEF